jgi:hypothetical protein
MGGCDNLHGVHALREVASEEITLSDNFVRPSSELCDQTFKDALQGRSGDVGGAAEVIVAHAAGALATGKMPEAEGDRLCGGTEVGKHGAQEFGEIHGVPIARGRRKGEKGGGPPP